MVEDTTRICSTREALAEMLRTASRRLERIVHVTPASGDQAQAALTQAKAKVEELTARLAHHRGLHQC